MNSQKPSFIGLGELLWDIFPDGPQFGGAPANFACHIAALGKHSEMASAVGSDVLGDRAIEKLQKRGVGTAGVKQDEQRPTGTVTVSLDEEGLASYEFAADVAWDAIGWSDELAMLAEGCTVVCFGTLGQRSEVSRTTIQRFVSSTRSSSLRIFDINVRPPFVSDSVIFDSLALANVLKLNDDELSMLTRLCRLSGTEAEKLRALADRFELQTVALTRGGQGAVLLRGGEISMCPGRSVSVVDTVGAGDAFTAVLAIGLVGGHALDKINAQACEVAAFVCSQAGATPDLPSQFTEGLNPLSE